MRIWDLMNYRMTTLPFCSALVIAASNSDFGAFCVSSKIIHSIVGTEIPLVLSIGKAVQAGLLANVKQTKPLVSTGGMGLGFERGEMADKLKYWCAPAREAMERMNLTELRQTRRRWKLRMLSTLLCTFFLCRLLLGTPLQLLVGL